MQDLLPPTNLSAEMCLLGSLLICDGDAEAMQTVTKLVPPDAFVDDEHRAVFAGICQMAAAGHQIDAVAFQAHMTRTGAFESAGGRAMLLTLLDAVPAWTHWPEYMRAIVDCYQRRRLIATAESLRAAAYLPANGSTAIDIAASAQEALCRVIESGSMSRYQPIGDVLGEVRAQLNDGETSYLPTGFAGLDATIGGIGFGECWILAARPSMGKSTLARQIAVGVAKTGIPVGFISLEENNRKMARNLLAAEAGVCNSNLRRGMLAQEEWTEIDKGVERLSGLPIYLCESARKLNEIAAVVAAMKARDKVQFLVIDYLQRIRGAKGQSRYEQVTELSIEISDLAKTSKLAVLCLAQLSRAVEGKEDKIPNLSDLRESGQIEQDADGVLFLHRPAYYGAAARVAGNQYGEAEIVIGKARDSVRGISVKLKSDLRHQRFLDHAESQHIECDEAI